ncbi:MAG: hypothetical protein ACR2QM_01905 [Longimicrobiales bacterium]
MQTRQALGILCIGLALGCVEAPAQSPPRTPGTPGDTEPFPQLVASLSEAGGYFDTDNLISNETSYLHALSDLDVRGLTASDNSGGAYLGVGPGQNFSYIAALRPDVAIIVDIRRDNMLQHLLFKALFDLSPSRTDYVANLIGRRPPVGTAAEKAETIDDILQAVDASSPLSESELSELRGKIQESIGSTGQPTSQEDLETIFRFHDEFRIEGLELRFRSHYRSPQPYYPSLRRLLVERDREGRQRSFLANQQDYEFLRSLQAGDRLIPIVGNLAGPSALVRVGQYLEAQGAPVRAFYTSNVEFYLFQDGTFGRFVDNLRALPLSGDGVLIRSYFNRFRATHPATVPGYASTQLVQSFDDFLTAVGEGVSYNELMFR